MSHPTVQLKVLSGPDKGKELRFRSSCIRLGRDPRKNDFVLTDQYISACHGQLDWHKGVITYLDLQSRHGTSITTAINEGGRSVEKRIELQDIDKITSYPIRTSAQLLIGSTLIYLTFLPADGNDTIEEQAAIHSPNAKRHANGEMSENSRVQATPIPINTVPYQQDTDEDPQPTGVFSVKSSHSLEDMEQGYVVENTSPRNLPLSQDQTHPDSVVSNLQPPKPLTSYSRHEVDTEPEDINVRKIFLSTSDTADEQALYEREKGETDLHEDTDFSFEELAKVSMNDTKFRGFQTQTEASMDSGFHQDMRLLVPNENKLDVLFRLSNQLNRLHHLDDILELIVDSTFEAFPSAQFFALYRTDRDSQRAEENGEKHTLSKYLSRVRDIERSNVNEVILSESLLEKVADKREAILFTRDSHANPTVSMIEGEIWSSLCAPLIGQRSLLGVMLVDTRHEGALFTPQDLNLFSVLASNAAFAIERTQLTEEIVNMFEGFVEASVSAIEARDPTTAGHSERVATFALSLAETVNDVHVGSSKGIYFTKDELVELRYAALLHDIGKVGVREDVLNKASRISDDRMNLIRQRFDSLKVDYHLSLTNKLLRELADQRRSPTDQEMQNIIVDASDFSEELEETVLWLDKIRRMEKLTPDDLKRVKKIASRRIPLSGDRLIPLLEHDETTNLSIVRGTLNDEEWQDMRSHASLSESYLERIPWSSELKRVPCIAGAHHEKLDGSGYPHGLKASDLFPQIRILTIADIFDALTAWDRPYRKAIPYSKAISILSEEAAAGKLDRDLVGIFALKVIPSLERSPHHRESSDELPLSIPTLKSSSGIEPLRAKTTGQYTLFQQEKFQSHTQTAKKDEELSTPKPEDSSPPPSQSS